MRPRLVVALVGFVLGTALLSAQGRQTFDIYVIDVEGGNATLFVTPAGESVLIDAGNGGANAPRDVGRILEAAEDAGLSQIDHHITTHWHGDHFGGLAELAKMIPIRAYYDHGPTIQPQELSTEFLDNVYPTIVAQATRTIVKAGDRIAVKGLEWRIVTSGGEVIQSALPGAGAQNPYCAAFTPRDPDPTENAQSVGSHITFGKFRVVHPGDLTWNKEAELMCPANRLGTADLLIVGHHGQPTSNSEVFVHALRPRVSIINNGSRKGGQPDAMRVILNSPGLEDVWQSHFSILSGQEYTVPGMFIANVFDDQPETLPIDPVMGPRDQWPAAPVHNGKAFWFKVSAQQDGTFSVTNPRNDFTKTYRAGD